MNKEKRRKPAKSITLHPSVIEVVDKVAKEEQRSFSEVVERALENYYLKN